MVPHAVVILPSATASADDVPAAPGGRRRGVLQVVRDLIQRLELAEHALVNIGDDFSLKLGVGLGRRPAASEGSGHGNSDTRNGRSCLYGLPAALPADWKARRIRLPGGDPQNTDWG
jgi:hypothetical protein